MDRRTIAAILLSLAIYYAWAVYSGAMAPPPEVIPQVAEQEAVPPPPPVPVLPEIDEPVTADGPPVRELPFSACEARGVVSTRGGALSDLVLDTYTAPYMVTPLYTWVVDRVLGKAGPWKPYGDDPGPAVLVSPSAEAFAVGAGKGPPVRFAVVEDAPGRLTLTGRTADGIEITRTLQETRAGSVCTIDASVTWRNTTAVPKSDELWVAMHDVVPESHSRYGSQRQPAGVVDGSLTYGGPGGAGCVRTGTNLTPETPRIPLEGEVAWFGLSDRYFGLYVVPADPGSGAGAFTRVERGDLHLDGIAFGDAKPLGPGEQRSASYRVYGGANQMERLSAVDPNLTKAVDLGWFAFFAWPLLWLLRKFHSILGNWGLAIILLTVLVKVLFFPMTQRSFRSMRRMQEIQPLLNEVRQKYADDPQEMNRRTMAVMAEQKVNPLSGCLPQLVQVPVWLALYNALLTSVELYHTRFLYLKDLSEPDPYLVLPVAITFLMWVQQRFSTPTNLDPTQQMLMRWMPLIFGLLFFAFPSGLAVYVFVNVSLSIGQQWLINRGAGPTLSAATQTPGAGAAT